MGILRMRKHAGAPRTESKHDAALNDYEVIHERAALREERSISTKLCIHSDRARARSLPLAPRHSPV